MSSSKPVAAARGRRGGARRRRTRRALRPVLQLRPEQDPVPQARLADPPGSPRRSLLLSRPRPSSRPPRWRTPRRATTPWRCSSATRSPSGSRSIVYASHTDFEQTNILPFTPPEGLLGVTDFLKRRVTLPFRGNFAEFRHTLRHEMVHVFQLELLSEGYLQAPRHSRSTSRSGGPRVSPSSGRAARTPATRW